MSTSDPIALGEWLQSIAQTIGGALRLDVSAFEAAIGDPRGLGLALIILFLAGVSVALGQSVVLFANRVPPGRFAQSLLGGAIVGTITVIFWSVVTWLTARTAYGVELTLRDFAIVVGLGCSPALFGVFLFLPYVGVVFGWILRIWVFLTILVGVGAVSGLAFLPALYTCVGGWLLLELLTRLPIFDLDRLRAWVWRVTTGRPYRHEEEDLANWLALQMQANFGAGSAHGSDSDLSADTELTAGTQP